MRKLQLGTSQEGQGPMVSHGELLTPAAAGEDQDSVEGYGWSMKRHPGWSGGSASTAKSVLSPCRACGWLLLSRLLCGARPGNVPQAVPPALGPWIQGQDSPCVRDWGQIAPLFSLKWAYLVLSNPHPTPFPTTPPLYFPYKCFYFIVPSCNKGKRIKPKVALSPQITPPTPTPHC